MTQNHATPENNEALNILRPTTIVARALLVYPPIIGCQFLDAGPTKYAAMAFGVSCAFGFLASAFGRLSRKQTYICVTASGLAGAISGAAIGYAYLKNLDEKNIAIAEQNAKNYATVPVQDSVAIRYPAERFCDNTDIKPTQFPNGEIRKIMQGADGKLVAVQCKPPSAKLAR